MAHARVHTYWRNAKHEETNVFKNVCLLVGGAATHEETNVFKNVCLLVGAPAHAKSVLKRCRPREIGAKSGFWACGETPEDTSVFKNVCLLVGGAATHEETNAFKNVCLLVGGVASVCVHACAGQGVNIGRWRGQYRVIEGSI